MSEAEVQTQARKRSELHTISGDSTQVVMMHASCHPVIPHISGRLLRHGNDGASDANRGPVMPAACLVLLQCLPVQHQTRLTRQLMAANGRVKFAQRRRNCRRQPAVSGAPK